jgi:two-component system, response regulator RegA
MKILIADDDNVFRERLAKAIAKRGHEMRTAENGAIAIEQAKNFSFDAAILDLKMPEMEGLACLKKLLFIHPTAKIIILTGYGSIATAMEAVRFGAWDYLTKPTDVEQILASLNREDQLSEQKLPETDPPSLERVEWEHIQRVLSDSSGNISEAARLLGMHRRSLQRKLQKYPPPR